MNTRNLIVAGIIAVVLSLVAVQAFAMPQYYGWGQMSTMGRNGHMNQGDECNMMNAQTTTPQQCQQHMRPNGSQMINGQYQQQCLQHMSPNDNMTPEHCQVMYDYCHN